MISVTLIAACDIHGAIGVGNKLPWHLPTDFLHFQQNTIGTSVIMGSKTYDSIGCALPRRQNIVLSRGDRDFLGLLRHQVLKKPYI